MKQVLLTFLLSLGMLFVSAYSIQAEEIGVWIGTSANDGIFYLKLNTQTGKLTQPKAMGTLGGAGFLARHPTKNVLYATAKKNKSAGVASYSIVTDGKQIQLKQTGFLASGDGGSACVAINKAGNVLFSAQYGGGSVTSYLVDGDGTLTSRVGWIEQGPGSDVVPRRQKTAHPHWVGTSPDDQLLFVPDLGMDAVVIYKVAPQTGKLTPHQTVACPSGGGPRHMKFHPSGNFIYVLNELKLTLSVFEYDAEQGKMNPIQEIATLPQELKDKHLNSAAEVRIHPTGKFLYASNRGHDSIAVFSIDEKTGKLSFVEREAVRGSWPRNFNLAPSGKWLLAAGQKSNTLALFEIDPTTGEMTFTRQVVNVPQPICVEFEKP